MYSGSSKVEESSFIVVTSRKCGCALILMPATMHLDVAAVVEQRREAGPALLAHAIAFVQNHDAARESWRVTSGDAT